MRGLPAHETNGKNITTAWSYWKGFTYVSDAVDLAGGTMKDDVRVRKAIQRGEIAKRTIPGTKTILVHPQDVRAWLNRNAKTETAQ